MTASEEPACNPLFKIAQLYVEEAAPASAPPSAVAAATDVLVRLLSGSCTYAEAAAECLSQINNSEPAHQIEAILQIAAGSTAESPQIPRQLSKRCRLWNHIDDSRLLAGILRYGIGDWKRIAEFVGNSKSGSQCSQRWSRALNPSLSKEQGTEEEDEELWGGVQTHGQHSWAKVARQVRSRSDVQCRYRYDQLRRMKKLPEPQKIVSVPLTLIDDPFQLAMEDLIPPLIVRKNGQAIGEWKGDPAGTQGSAGRLR
jgi:hypothetical protein